jgi:hypothetical protein
MRDKTLLEILSTLPTGPVSHSTIINHVAKATGADEIRAGFLNSGHTYSWTEVCATLRLLGYKYNQDGHWNLP